MKVLNRKSLKNFRRKLRNKSTSAEATLWIMIKNRKIEGRKFRRQYSISNFIVDFYCPSEKMIIELDGDYHGEYINIERDIKRDQILKNMGFKILRFENKSVFQDPEYVIEEIKSYFINKQI